MRKLRPCHLPELRRPQSRRRHRGVGLTPTAVERMRRGEIALGNGFDNAGRVRHGGSDAISGFFAYGYRFRMAIDRGSCLRVGSESAGADMLNNAVVNNSKLLTGETSNHRFQLGGVCAFSSRCWSKSSVGNVRPTRRCSRSHRSKSGRALSPVRLVAYRGVRDRIAITGDRTLDDSFVGLTNHTLMRIGRINVLFKRTRRNVGINNC